MVPTIEIRRWFNYYIFFEDGTRLTGHPLITKSMLPTFSELAFARLSPFSNYLKLEPNNILFWQYAMSQDYFLDAAATIVSRSRLHGRRVTLHVALSLIYG